MRKALFALLLFATPAWAQSYEKVAGLYDRVYYEKSGKAVKTLPLELTVDGKVMENGKHTANWKIESGHVLITILNPKYGIAKLKIKVNPIQLEGFNIHKNGDMFRWVMTRSDKVVANPTVGGNSTVKIRFIFRCSATGEVYDNIVLNNVTLISGGQTVTAKISNQTATFENMPLNTKWRMQCVYDGSRQVSLEITVDSRTERTCTVDS